MISAPCIPVNMNIQNMSRSKLQLPEKFSFSCDIPVRITDLNYGGHTGNDTILSLIHEARMQFLQSLGYTEMNMEGIGMIMADAAIEFKSELFYPDTVIAWVKAGDITRVGFDLYYKIERKKGGSVAIAKTAMVCYDYGKKKIVSLPGRAAEKLLLL